MTMIPPRDEGVDGDRPLQPVSGSKQQELGVAAGLSPKEVPDAPPLELESDDLGGGTGVMDGKRGEQEHLSGFSSAGGLVSTM